MGFVARETPCQFFAMASWHLFNQGWLNRFLMRLLGGFSVNREGLDRQAIDEAVRILKTAERPLLIFPEGTTSRTNDQLMALMDGPAFIARTAAKRRAEGGRGQSRGASPGNQICLSRQFGKGRQTKVLTDIEKRLTWRPSPELPLVDRLIKIGNGLLTLKELEYQITVPETTTLRERQTAMVNQLLAPLEQEWLGGVACGDGIAVRIKNLRMKIFPELSRNDLAGDERQRRWRQLQDTYLAQQIDCYPEQYVTKFPSVDRILETHRKIRRGPDRQMSRSRALESDHRRGRTRRGCGGTSSRPASPGDPLMHAIRGRLESMLSQLQTESRMYAGEGLGKTM